MCRNCLCEIETMVEIRGETLWHAVWRDSDSTITFGKWNSILCCCECKHAACVMQFRCVISSIPNEFDGLATFVWTAIGRTYPNIYFWTDVALSFKHLEWIEEMRKTIDMNNAWIYMQMNETWRKKHLLLAPHMAVNRTKWPAIRPDWRNLRIQNRQFWYSYSSLVINFPPDIGKKKKEKLWFCEWVNDFVFNQEFMICYDSFPKCSYIVQYAWQTLFC